MGITLGSKNLSVDLGYGGFRQFRKKVANLMGTEFGIHYEELDKGFFLYGEEASAFFEQYNAKTEQLIELKEVTPEIANFCYQSDCKGKIDRKQAKQIYKKIKKHDDNVAYGYVGRSDCAVFSDLKAIFKDCVINGGKIKWR